MANHPLNLGLRFFLELAALFSLGYWGWTQQQGLMRILLTIAIPLIAAILWGVFRVPGDPGNAPVPVPGALRLALEMAFFTSATLGLFFAQQKSWALTFGIITLLHYLISYDRILWLLRR
ncbi:MAG: YrdB family protein [Anaerolineales bacterium]|nr:YrdB family protein [Anaerolineales bacterium]